MYRQRRVLHVGRAACTRSARSAAVTNVLGRPARDPAPRSSRARATSSGPIAAPDPADFSPIASTRRRRRCAAPARYARVAKETRRLVRRDCRSTRARRATRRTTTRSSSAPTTSGTTRTSAAPGRSRRSWYRQIYVASRAGRRRSNYEGDRTAAAAPHVLSRRRRRSSGTSAAFYIHRRSAIDDRQLRGGPAIEAPTQSTTWRRTSRRDSRHAVDRQRRASATTGTTRAARSPAISLERDVSAGVERQRVVRSVVESVAQLRAVRRARSRTRTAKAFYGTRYVMSSSTSARSASTRALSLTFSPTMTLELYVQPFFAAGRYYDFEEYVAPRTTATARVRARSRNDRGDARCDGGRSSRSTRSIRTAPARRRVHDRQSQFQPAVAARQRGVPVGVSTGVGALRGVDAIAARRSRRSAIWISRAIDRRCFAARPDNIFLVKASWWLAR